jgi:uncharacterized protein (DUF302 family)
MSTDYRLMRGVTVKGSALMLQTGALNRTSQLEPDMNQTTVAYAMVRIVPLTFEQADRAVRDALQQEGFGILTEADVAATLKQKLNVDIGSYEILGVCLPSLAHQGLQSGPDLGLLLPCNLVVRNGARAGEAVVAALDPVVQLGVSQNQTLRPLAEQVRERIERVLDRLVPNE